ncbi:SEC-C domain-containing protein [bacterium]|nr:SEC-C domain-containing protein [bacterium]
MNVQRNEPCPCGSGKKYKKCCLSHDEENAPRFVSVAGEAFADPPEPEHDHALCDVHGHAHDQDEQPQDERSIEMRRLGRLSPYAVSKIVSKNRDLIANGRRFCLPEDVAKLTTEEILEHFAKLRIALDQEKFVGLSRVTFSAWKVSSAWRFEGMDPYDDDFLGIASCELWKRWSPERPSVETLDDWMQEGYELVSKGEREKALDLWERTWGVIRSRLTPEMKTCDAAGEVFDGSQCLFNWTQDLTLEWLDLAENPSHAERGIKYVRELLAQFTEEGVSYRTNARADLGDLLFAVVRNDEAARIFLDLIREHPDMAIGYVRLSAQLEDADPQQAVRLLEEAQKNATDCGDWDVDVRLEDLREQPSIESAKSAAREGRAPRS